MRTRRNVLRAGSAVALATVATPALAKLANTDHRDLSFDNLHTGEKLRVDYWVGGDYLPDALNEINYLLRDFRTNQVHEIEPKLLDLLNLLHRKMGSGAPFQVISGYRSPKTNAILHAHSHEVATHSLHMSGMAIDIRLSDRDLKDLHEAALAMRAGGVGYYPHSDFVHVDVGRVRRWNG